MRPRDILVNITERYITLKVSSITQPLYFAYTLHRSEMQRGCSRDMMSGASAGKILMLTVTWQLGVEIIWKCLHSYIWMLMLVVIKKDKKDPGWSTIWRTYRRMAEYAKREPWVSIMAGTMLGEGGLIGCMIKSRLKMVLMCLTPMPKPRRWTFFFLFLGLLSSLWST